MRLTDGFCIFKTTEACVREESRCSLQTISAFASPDWLFLPQALPFAVICDYFQAEFRAHSHQACRIKLQFVCSTLFECTIDADQRGSRLKTPVSVRFK